MKKQIIRSKNYLMVILFSLVPLCAHSHESTDEKEYLVQFQSGQIDNALSQNLNILWRRDNVSFAKGKLNQEQANALKALTDVVVEENPSLALNAGSLRSLPRIANNADVLAYNELEPYWLRATAIEQLPHAVQNVPVCVIDSGLDAEHPDLPTSTS